MKQLFLTSEVNMVSSDIRKKIKTKNGTLKTAYITTPLERGHEDDDLIWSKENQSSMLRAGFEIFEYTITDKRREDLEKDLGECDVIYVEGGSLVHMMNQVRASGFDFFIIDFLNKGGVYIGTSTGSFIAAQDTGPGLSLETYLEEGFDTKGIGLVNFLVMPHWGTDVFRESYIKMPKDAYDMKVPMIILNDLQYVWVHGENMHIVDLANTQS